ncbi:hypothetical protein CYLTODRAFT_419465, partial [Cylindrobasidium torrendii FP15055 ss-10]
MSLPLSVPPPHVIGSAAFRASLAAANSALRPVKFGQPFWKLPVHRVPTLHLYRALLREARTENIRFRVKLLFHENQHLTGTKRTREVLAFGHKLLEVLQNGDSAKLVDRYDRLIGAKRTRADHRLQEQDALNWIDKMRNRPILTGGFMTGSLYHPPLPRMKPQPLHVTGMINYRIKKYLRLQDKQAEIQATMKDLQAEMEGERILNPNKETQFYASASESWLSPLKKQENHIKKWYTATRVRKDTPIPLPLFKQVFIARRTRVENKTRERERERKGEVLKSTLRRRRQGPPPHQLATLGKSNIERDKYVRRGISEVGYLGMVKQNMGFNLKRKDGDTRRTKKGVETWSVLEGRWISSESDRVIQNRWDKLEKENSRRGETGM